jgi:peptide/nickel transport system substrate-binding protein/microcin C transport system substrate-binding protein
MKFVFQFILIVLLSSKAWGQAPYANPKAPKGGTFYLRIKNDPQTINPISVSDAVGATVLDYIFDRTLDQHPDTYEYIPHLAERYEVSKDNKEFTYYLRKDVVFSDGKPLTAEDVKFTYDAIMDPKYEMAHSRASLSQLDKVEVLDPYTVRFKMKNKHFRNFEVLATYFPILPKHIYEGGKNNKGKVVIGSGPYVLEKWDRGKAITLARNPKWWGWNDPRKAGQYNFDKIVFKIIREDESALISMSRGDLDFIDLTPEQYVKKTSGGKWGKEVLKKEVQNLAPKGFNFVAWNFKRDIFKDKRVRQALVHLMDRKLMNERFRYGKSELATGPWDKFNFYADQSVKPFEFDAAKAKKLFADAGWADTDKDGILDKVINGKKVDMRFSLMSSNPDFQKYLTIYKEALKQGGVDMTILQLEWNAFIKKLEERDFDAAGLAWGRGSNNIDPRQIWHSESAQPGGSNFNSYANPEVDKLIDAIGLEFDKNKRAVLTKKVYRIIADDAPYAFMFNEPLIFYAHTARTQMLKPTYKYGLGMSMWWF